MKNISLGEILFASQIIGEGDISSALEEQKRSGSRFGEALVSLGIVTQEDVNWAISNQLNLPYIRLKQEMIDLDAVRLVPSDMARKFNFIPLIKAGNELNIAIADPLNRSAVEAIEKHTGCSVNIAVALIREIREMIVACYGSVQDATLGFESASFAEKELQTINSDLSGRKLLDYLLVFILQNRLSSLSLQPLGDIVTVCGSRSAVSTRIGTIASNFYPDISIKLRKSAGLVQNCDLGGSGLLTLNRHTRPITFQISVLPGYGGDFFTIRHHVAADVPSKLSELHLPVQQENRFAALAMARSGITFFASRDTEERNGFIDLMLEEMDTTGKNVIILGEGPGRISKRFPRILLPTAEAERAKVIMAALDHAPDILVIENVTEGLPFSAACRSAMRGKLVLAGLEIRGTRNVLRHLLLNRHNNGFLPIFANGLVSFKGIQILCPECRIGYIPPLEELAALNLAKPPESFFRSTGCVHCGHRGNSSRHFLVDVLTFDEQFTQVFNHSANVEALEKHLDAIGYQGADEEGLQLLLEGKVAPEEYLASVVL